MSHKCKLWLVENMLTQQSIKTCWVIGKSPRWGAGRPWSRQPIRGRETRSKVTSEPHNLTTFAIVIGPTRVTWYVQIITVDRCIGAAVNSTGQHYRSALPVNITSRSEDVIPCICGWCSVRTLYCYMTIQNTRSWLVLHASHDMYK